MIPASRRSHLTDLMEHLIPIPVGSYNILILVGAKCFFGCRGFTEVQFSLYDKEDCRIGIGSGVLKVPAMDAALRLPIKVSSATSNFMICVTAAASAGAYFVRGDIVALIAGPVALGSVIGAILGARLLMSISSERIRLLFVVVLVALAAQMFHSAFGPDLIRGTARAAGR
jgi:hypothetical protein